MQNNILAKLINTERNKNFLKNVVSREFLDLSVVYYFMQADVPVFITNEMLEDWEDLTEEELFTAAIENDSFQIIDYAKIFGFNELAGPRMSVITNEEIFFGATVILNKKNLHAIADLIGLDIWLIPSSVHEWMILRKDNILKPEEIKENILAVNDTLKPDEILSDHPYYYEMETGKIKF